MIVRVQTYASLREIFGKEFEVDIDGNTVKDLIISLQNYRPSAGQILENCLVAVSDSMVEDRFILKEGQSVVVMPPASGG